MALRLTLTLALALTLALTLAPTPILTLTLTLSLAPTPTLTLTLTRWHFAPYRFNQATLSNGELPHAADTVTAWPSHLRRVVIGINSMGRVEGPSECALPQHSKAFKRHLKLTQLEAMLRDMPPEARSKLVARAKGKVAARETARQGSQTSSTPD